jgi:hypothetical protein
MMETITIYPKNEEQTNLFEQLAKTLKVPFEKKAGHYNAAFVAKIQRSRKDYKEGKGTVITLQELKELCK